MAHLVPVGSLYVEEGDADLEGAPVSTPGRLRRGLDAIGYDAVTEVVPAGDHEVRLKIHLRAYDRVRTIFVAGNWPLRQDQIVRRISVRPGQSLPLPGPERDARLELEKTRVLDYLHSQGYFDAQVTIELNAAARVPAPVNLVVRINLGSAYPIGPVSVRGNKAIPSREIADKVRHQDWRWLWTRPMAFEQSLITDDLRDLTQRYRDLGYAGARITSSTTLDQSAKKVRLEIEVNEKKHIDVTFEGNDRFSDYALRDKVTIFARGAYDDGEVEASKEALAQYYRERGHMLVRVDARRERLSPEADRITFVIDEGPVLKVRGVAFTGNKVVPSRTLADVVNVKVFPPLGAIGLGEGGYASLRQLSLDVDNLVVYYKTLGFPQPQVRCELAPGQGRFRPLGPITQQQEAEWRSARDLFVRFVIDEGVRVRLAEIRFESMDGGPLPRDDAFMRELLLSRVGAPVMNGRIREDTDRLKRFLGDQGYPHASVEPDVKADGDHAVLTWQLKPGQQVRVGPVFTRGNFVTKENTILLWVPMRTGSVLTTTAAERGERNLALIQLFNNASPVSFPAENATSSAAAGHSSARATTATLWPAPPPASPTRASSAPSSASSSPAATSARPRCASATSARAAAPSASRARCSPAWTRPCATT
jgi:outer membrane protein assembly factor BamA